MSKPGAGAITESATDDRARIRRARAGRRVGLAAVALLVIAGASGALGVRTAKTTSTAGPYRLSVTYAAVARPGLAAPWEIEVTKKGGFDRPIRIAASSEYLSMFDENGLDPDPASATADADEIVWEFEPPPGDTLVVSFDARIEPAVQWGRSGRTRVLDERGATVVAVSYRTWVMP